MIKKVNIKKLASTLVNIVRPTIKEYYYSKNKHQMDAWEGNCCTQTAIIVANIMHTSISGLGYIVKAYYGNFIDIFQGNQVQYGHCWVYCELKADPEQSIFIDVGRTTKQCVVMHRKSNTYDKAIPDYSNQYIVDSKELDYKTSLGEIEEFTQEKVLIAYNEIIKRVCNQKLFK